MSVFQRGIPVSIVERFWTVDVLTEELTPADPTQVVFEVKDPDENVTTYEWGVDAEVTNPAVGVFVLSLPPPLPTGVYRSVCVGSGAVEATSPATVFEVLEDGVLPPQPGKPPTLGPCTSWINGEDVTDFGCSVDTGSTGSPALDSWAVMASMLLFELSGRQFHGDCERTVRPCRDTCGCFLQDPTFAVGTWSWALWPGGGGTWAWQNECGDRCGCGAESSVRLAGYPVRQIVRVKVDGELVDAAEYRLDGRRSLIRLADPGPPVRGRLWPSCQNLALDDDQPGTFSVTYRWGVDPPPLGREAAAQLACELAKAGKGSKDCKLPDKATKVVRQGVTVERVTPIADLLRSGSTGLKLVDAFLAQVNPARLRRRTLVYSPDMPEFPRQVG